MRHVRKHPYSTMPQKPDYEDERVVLYRKDRNPRRYDIEDVVFKARRDDPNCIEWLNRRTSAPELPPFNRETHAICANPNCHVKGKPQILTEFYADERKKNRRYSICKACHRKVTSEARRIGARVDIGVM
jgi:hypothetical protein